MVSPRDFVDYPEATEGPNVKPAFAQPANPTFRGLPLLIGANIICRVPFLQRNLWESSGFGKLRDMPALRSVPFRFHPCVIPLGQQGTRHTTILDFEPELLRAKYTTSNGRYYTVNDYHEMYKSGSVTPLDVAEALLGLITKGQNPPSKYADAWLDTRGKEHLALDAARASTERYAAGKSLGVLDGVPVGVKDDSDVKGYVTHIGMKYNPSVAFFKEAEDTLWAVKKLQEAGAVVIGKNCMHELGSDTSGCNASQGTPTNWHNKAYYPGGSSSGGGSTIGAGLVPICVGSDAGGSSRIPPAFNGVYGLKPTHHRAGVLDNTMNVKAPLAATVADLTVAYRIMAQPDPDNSTQSKFAVSLPPAPSAKRVLGISRDWWSQADPEVAALCDRAVAHFATAKGYEVVDIPIPYMSEAQTAHGAVCIVEMAREARLRTEHPADWLSIVGPANKVLLAVATQTTAADYLVFNTLRELIMRHLAFLFQKHPGLLIVTPTTPVAGWPRHPGDDAYGLSDTNMTLRNMMFVFLANMTGTPSVTAPVGYVDPKQGEGRLPVALMATGEWGAEEQLLAWAGEAEEYLHETYEGGRRRPAEWVDVLGMAKSRRVG